MGEPRVDDLIHEVIEVDPDGLQEVEFAVSQTALDGMAGKTVKTARVGATEVAVTMTDGTTYAFYGFIGERRSNRT